MILFNSIFCQLSNNYMSIPILSLIRIRKKLLNFFLKYFDNYLQILVANLLASVLDHKWECFEWLSLKLKEDHLNFYCLKFNLTYWIIISNFLNLVIFNLLDYEINYLDLSIAIPLCIEDTFKQLSKRYLMDFHNQEIFTNTFFKFNFNVQKEIFGKLNINFWLF